MANLYTAMKTWASAVLPASDVNKYLRDNMKAIMEAESYGTTLPTSPIDGQLFFYVADDAKGIMWTLKYRSAYPAGKQWACVGGPPLEATVDISEVIGASTAYSNFATTCQVTVPLAGDYYASFGVGRWDGLNTNLHYVAPRYGTAATATDGDAAVGVIIASATSSIGREGAIKTLLATDVVALQYRQAVSQAGETVSGKYLRLHPIRVG